MNANVKKNSILTGWQMRKPHSLKLVIHMYYMHYRQHLQGQGIELLAYLQIVSFGHYFIK